MTQAIPPVKSKAYNFSLLDQKIKRLIIVYYVKSHASIYLEY
jgi:hypothetical protein